MIRIEDAIQIALQKNFNVQIARNNQQIAKELNVAGNAGLSPTVSVNGGINTSLLNSYQEFNNGTTQDRPGASATGMSASLNADWLIYDGGRMFAIKKRLTMEEARAVIELKQQMESTVYEVISAYYNIVRIKALIRAAGQNLSIYDERLKIASMKFDIGSDSKVDLLLTRSDKNKAQSAIVQLQQELMNVMSDFNVMLGRRPESEFLTADSLQVNYEPVPEDLRKSALSMNNALQLSRMSEKIAELSVREARSGILPSLQASGAYLFNTSQSQAGFILYNRQTGFTGGLSARWVIFSGQKNRSLISQRSILQQNQKLFTEQMSQDIDGLVFIQYKSFQLSSQILKLEKDNIRDAQELSQISLERYRIGKAPLLETMEVQRNLEETQVRYINALYAMKQSEAKLLKVSGQLVK
jgi:outer membrane protein